MRRQDPGEERCFGEEGVLNAGAHLQAPKCSRNAGILHWSRSVGGLYSALLQTILLSPRSVWPSALPETACLDPLDKIFSAVQKQGASIMRTQIHGLSFKLLGRPVRFSGWFFCASLVRPMKSG